MNERLLDDVVHDMDKQFADSEYIKDRFIEIGREYVETADDPTTEQIKVMVKHFEDRDPDEISEESLSLLWVMSGVLTWMVEDLPLQGQTTDPEWLRKKLELWGNLQE